MERVALEKRLAGSRRQSTKPLPLNVIIGRKSELQFILSEPEREETPPSEIGGDDDNDCSESS